MYLLAMYYYQYYEIGKCRTTFTHSPSFTMRLPSVVLVGAASLVAAQSTSVKALVNITIFCAEFFSLEREFEFCIAVPECTFVDINIHNHLCWFRRESPYNDNSSFSDNVYLAFVRPNGCSQVQLIQRADYITHRTPCCSLR